MGEGRRIKILVPQGDSNHNIGEEGFTLFDINMRLPVFSYRLISLEPACIIFSRTFSVYGIEIVSRNSLK